jgi:hypothetical protein
MIVGLVAIVVMLPVALDRAAPAPGGTARQPAARDAGGVGAVGGADVGHACRRHRGQ